MVTIVDLPANPDGKLAENITHFARALRRAGLPVGPARVIEAIRAVEAVGFTERTDFFHTLRACFVSRPEQLAVFSQVFRLYWRDPQFLERMMAAMLPQIKGGTEQRKAEAAERRAAEALLDGTTPPQDVEQEGEEVEFDATLTFSASEKLRSMDFEQMSAAEIAQAKQMIARLDLPVAPIASRRLVQTRTGSRADWRGTVRASIRQGGEMRTLLRRSPGKRWPDLVALCDISGSMAGYSRMLLHFLHTAAHNRGAGWARVHAFTFGTRLTNVTRPLMARDADQALRLAGTAAPDWEGGTRIADCLQDFNRTWARRVMARGATVILITDGLDRGSSADLGREVARLRLFSRKLIWLNPLLRWDGFAARAEGVRAMLPQVDSFRACHSLASLEDLADALTRPDDQGVRQRLIRGMQDDAA